MLYRRPRAKRFSQWVEYLGEKGAAVSSVAHGPDRPVQRSVLRRALAILDCFGAGETELTVAGLARRTGLPPATVHRLLAVLVDWGGVERSSRGRYRLGMRLWRMGSLVPHARTLRDVALPFLEDLYESTHGVVHLTVLDGIEVLYVEKISSRRSVSLTSSVGKRLPAHASGPGKVLLAYSPPEVLAEVLRAGLPRLTPNTISDEHTLRRVLAEVRSAGYAVSRAEMSDGYASVAAPLFTAPDTVAASVSVVVTPDQLKPGLLAPLVTTVARAISRALATQHR